MIDEWSHDSTGFARFSDDRTKRYRLSRALTGGRVGLDPVRAVFVMLNPSTADAFKVDPTVGKCCKLAAKWGADVLEVVNLFAFRSPYPSDLYPRRGEIVREWRPRIGADADNDAAILEVCRGATHVIAAWGNHGALGSRDREIAKLLDEHGVPLLALGTNDNGSPIHPLARGRRSVNLDVEPKPWP